MLFGLKFISFQNHAGRQRRQRFFFLFTFNLIIRGAIQGHKTGKFHGGAAGIKEVGTGLNGNGILIDQGLFHLGGDKSLPDQAV